MPKPLQIVFFVAALFGCLNLTAQVATVDSTATETEQTPPPPPKKEFVFKPTFGLGTGMFSYYGDLYQKHLVSPQVSRVGFDLHLYQPIAPGLNLGFYAMFGKLGANERLIYRNINFESQIRIGGAHLEYNFDFLAKQICTTPIITFTIIGQTAPFVIWPKTILSHHKHLFLYAIIRTKRMYAK
jgi:hypothetical protein